LGTETIASVAWGAMGRHKKNGARYPGGKLKPTGEPIQPALWQRIRSDGAKAAGDHRLASEIGRLSYHRELTDLQVTAALRVAQIIGAWERQNGLNRRMHSPSYEAGFGGGRARLDDPAAIEAINEAYASLDQELQLYPATWRATLESLCCNDEFIPSERLPGVRGMLDALALFFGVSKSKSKRRERKAPALRLVKPAPAAQAVQIRRETPDKSAYLAMLKHMRPDLDDEARATAWDLFLAMKDREQFNRSKDKR
jgi:hypothetical protein